MMIKLADIKKHRHCTTSLFLKTAKLKNFKTFKSVSTSGHIANYFVQCPSINNFVEAINECVEIQRKTPRDGFKAGGQRRKDYFDQVIKKINEEGYVALTQLYKSFPINSKTAKGFAEFCNWEESTRKVVSSVLPLTIYKATMDEAKEMFPKFLKSINVSDDVQIIDPKDSKWIASTTIQKKCKVGSVKLKNVAEVCGWEKGAVYYSQRMPIYYKVSLEKAKKDITYGNLVEIKLNEVPKKTNLKTEVEPQMELDYNNDVNHIDYTWTYNGHQLDDFEFKYWDGDSLLCFFGIKQNSEVFFKLDLFSDQNQTDLKNYYNK